jgi:hypothetical protein
LLAEKVLVPLAGVLPAKAVTNVLAPLAFAELTVTDVMRSQEARPVVVIVELALVNVVVPLYTPDTAMPKTAGVIV